MHPSVTPIPETRPLWRAAVRAFVGQASLLAMSLGLVACAGLPADEIPERIVNLRSGQVLSRDELVAILRSSDYALLGEQHDNPIHHQRRGELLAALGSKAAVVAEQLPRGQHLAPQGPVLQRLQAAGFDAQAWRWPLHEPLFSAAMTAGIDVSGGNLLREAVRQVARTGEAGLSADAVQPLQAAPLSGPASAALDAELIDSHCGQLPPSRVPAMRWAQRARDASMWAAMQAVSGQPVVLVAGNGHVRLDYGVPQLIAALKPAARFTVVGFVEQGADLQSLREVYTYAWITAAPPDRGDPCADFAAPVPSGTASSPR